MIVATICRGSVSQGMRHLLKTPVVPKIGKIQVTRLYGSEGRTAFSRSARRRTTLMEDAVAPAGETAFNIGKGIVAGGAVVGLGALCYYGAGLSSATGAIDHAAFWPEYVKDRIKSTYMYFGGSIVASAATAAVCLRSPAVMRMVTRGGWVAFGVSLVAMMGSGILVQSLPYKEGFGAKQAAWLVHSGIIGAVLAPLTLLGGALIIRAACYTAGIVGGLSAVAVCAPSEKFLNLGGPLAVCLGAVFASSVGSMFLPPTTLLGSSLHSLALYGGLVVFSVFLLYDTQRIIRNAETYPVANPQYYYGNDFRPYDPINSSISIYLDTINIFVRMVSILSGGGGRRK